ncbi:MAG: hypothetical protein AAGE76_14375 [Pseudomonadota bacterium]
MTALEEYLRLEAPGRWRETPQAAWREVVVSFGHASLVLTDFSDTALTHWSLAAVQRVADSDDGTVRYAPDAGAAEMLEITDPAMVEAIARAQRMAQPPRHSPALRGYLRTGAWALLIVAAVAAAAVAGYGLVRQQAPALISPEQAAAVSAEVEAGLGARRCTGAPGVRALGQIAARLQVDVAVMDWAAPAVAELPDGTILLARAEVERAVSAEVVAGWAALAQVAAPAPLPRWLDGLNPRTLLKFVTSGTFAPADIEALAGLVRATPLPRDPDLLRIALDGLATRGIDPVPFRRGAAARGLLPAPGTADEHPPPRPLLPQDRDWVALQNICGG